MDFVGSNATISGKTSVLDSLLVTCVWGGLGVNFVCDSFISHDTFLSTRREMIVRQ